MYLLFRLDVDLIRPVDVQLDIGFNLVHGSDGPETAAQELALWFSADELVSYQRVIDAWIYE